MTTISIMPVPTDDLPSIGATGRVLVVDDDAGGRQLLADWLAAYGHEVEQAADGAEALRRIAQNPPDTVVLDVMMPGLDGFTVCERIKRDPETVSIPVLLLTALDEKEDRLRGMRAGANDFLNKPVDLPYVLLRVRNAVLGKKMRDELAGKYRALRELERLRDDLMQMVVHDLRTPLAALEGYLELLKLSEDNVLGERPRHYLNQALRAAHSLAHQIDMLLDIHRLEEGKMPVESVAHDLTRVVQNALAPLQPLFGARQVEVEMPPQPFTVLGDPGLLSRVLTNLVGNAIAFTSPDHGRIRIRAAPTGLTARIEIVDNGPGIDPEHHAAIFDKFRQVGGQARDRSSGLGLAFCKLAVEAQRGRIGVESRVGDGSRFWFEVPAGAA